MNRTGIGVTRWMLLGTLVISMVIPAPGQSRVKDVASVTGLHEVQMFGYGLVVGLAGTGDRNQTVFTTQTISNMLKNMGIELPERYMRIRNVAAVIVTGTLTPFKKVGTRLDVTVSSLGDARSLEGGTLILTPLQGPDGQVYASAQGPIATGGYDVRNRGLTRIKRNHVLVGRIPDGAIVQRQFNKNPLSSKELSLSLFAPDFTSAVAMAEAINERFEQYVNQPIARAEDAATVSLRYELLTEPEPVENDEQADDTNAGQDDTDESGPTLHLVEFISLVENVEFQVAHRARVVVNERTGTIVAGGNVTISEIAVTHGGVKVEIINTPEVIQPPPFTQGQTTVIPEPQMVVEEKEADMVVLNGTTTVADLAQSLNSLGVAPRDVIAIFQAIKQAGALQGQLLIM